MKDDSQYMTTVTTATLELGIDIGRWNGRSRSTRPGRCPPFLQRMGRTGRRELPPEMWFVMREDEPEARAMLPTTIPWKLLQGIALVQLYLEERWVEPPRLDRLPYSLLYHQTMSTLASCGEMSPRALADRVLRLHYFHRISQEDYKNTPGAFDRHRPDSADGAGRLDCRHRRGAGGEFLQVLRRVSRK